MARIKPIPESHDRTDRIASMQLAFTEEPLYTGLFYQATRPTIGECFEEIRKASYQE